MSNNQKKVNVRRIYLKHDDKVHEFKTFTSPFVCRVCYHDPYCPIVMDGFSDEPIELLNFNKFEKQYKYESINFYGEGYCMDLITIEIKLVNSYAFSVLISRESPFTEMPIDFHEVTSNTVLTPRIIHENILDKLATSCREIESFKTLLNFRRDESNNGVSLNGVYGIY